MRFSRARFRVAFVPIPEERSCLSADPFAVRGSAPRKLLLKALEARAGVLRRRRFSKARRSLVVFVCFECSDSVFSALGLLGFAWWLAGFQVFSWRKGFPCWGQSFIFSF